MPENIINLIQENVIQGRTTRDDEGMDEGIVGQPALPSLLRRLLPPA